MVVAGTALNAATFDSLSGSGATVSVALLGSSKPIAEEGLHKRSSNMFYHSQQQTYNLQVKALGYL
jgi:hypothetical protein